MSACTPAAAVVEFFVHTTEEADAKKTYLEILT
jgi:hypothetical protein